MANEIRITENIVVSKSNFKDTINPGTILVTMAGTGGGGPGIVSIGTSAEDISFGDVAPGMIWMRNLDSTNFVSFGMSDGGTIKILGKLPAGRSCRFELAAGTTLRMIADTATCKVLIKAYDA